MFDIFRGLERVFIVVTLMNFLELIFQVNFFITIELVYELFYQGQIKILKNYEKL